MKISKRLVALVAVLLLVVGGVGYLYLPRGDGLTAAIAATLAVLDTDISSQHGGGDFRPALDGDLLANGDVVKSSADGRAVLTFFDGSTLTVETGSIVKVVALNRLPSGGILLTIEQTLGRTWASVAKLKTPDSKFEVRTPTSTASVRGTAFETIVVRQPDGSTAVTYRGGDGEVVVTANAGGVTSVTANTEVTIGQGQPAPAAPVAIPPGPMLRITSSAGVGFAATAPSGATCGSAGNRAEMPGCTVSGDAITVRDPAAGRYLVMLTAAAPAPNATLKVESLVGTTVRSTQTLTRAFALGDLVRTAFTFAGGQQATLSPFEPDELITSVCGAQATGRVFSAGAVQERYDLLRGFAATNRDTPVSLVVTDADLQESVRRAIAASDASAPATLRGVAIATTRAGIHLTGDVVTPVGTFAASGDVVAGPVGGRLTLRVRELSAGPLPSAILEQLRGAIERGMDDFTASFPMVVRRVALREGCLGVMGTTPR